VWHENSPFIQSVESGLREKFDELGIEVIASTSAEFDAAQQAANVETVLANDPDIIVTIAVDPTTAAEAFRPAVEQGVKIVVLTTPPAGYTAGEEMVGIVTTEATAYGKAAAELLGEALGGQGQVGWIFHDADFWFTNQRDQAFKDWLAYLYPDIEVVDEGGFSDPARTEDIANAMLTRNPELNGMYVAWATAADGALAALRAAERDDVKVVTNDLEENLALDMVQGGNVIGVVANPAVDLGRYLGIMAAYGVLEKEAPEMAVATPLATTADNLTEGWQAEFDEDPPEELLEAAGG
jgi:ribose transport system substrate-binding protein